jgi:hypothetical protein
MDHTSSEAPTTRSDHVRSSAEEGGSTGGLGSSGTLVLWQVLGLLVRAGVEESMVSELLSLDSCVYCVVSELCAKNKRDAKKCRLGQELIRAKCVVFRSPSVPVRFRFFPDILFTENLTYFGSK